MMENQYKQKDDRVMVIFPSGEWAATQSVEAALLLDILNKLEEIRCGIIDVEDSIEKSTDTTAFDKETNF
tara:strand:- start:30860 stop:31069 length:210 start_codon:yes stop_codon:yes gene_type:complete